MSRIGSILLKVAVFGGALVVSFVAVSVVMAALKDRSAISHVGEQPEYVLTGADTPAGPGPVAAFVETPVAAPAPPLPSLSPEDAKTVSTAVLGGPAEATTSKVVNPSGFARIRPITQFDGGRFQGSNCTLASGAMLARLAAGIVTNGSTLRGLQDDQEGGTDLNDLDQALWRGYRVNFKHGMIQPKALKRLLAAGYGAVVQGIYGEIPVSLRLQRNFTGGHAIYLDGYYPGDAVHGIPEAYYVVDPIGRPRSGYEGDWWPASVVDRFTAAWGGSRVSAMWAFPPGGVPPEVVGPDVLPIKHGGGGGGPKPTPGSNDTPAPTPGPGDTPAPTPGPTATPAVPAIDDPGDTPTVLDPPLQAPVDGPVSPTTTDVVPVFDICLVTPATPGCPTGIEAVFTLADPPALVLPPGPVVTVRFVASDQANKVLVGFTVDPPATANVKFWANGVSPAAVLDATTISTLDLSGTPVLVAELDTQAATTYQFQAVASDGLLTGVSDVGTFTTGSGVKQFDVVLASAASPKLELQAGLSPYLHPAEAAFARPMLPLALVQGGCTSSATFGTLAYCLDQGALAPPVPACTTADASWELAGITADAVLVRAFPVEKGLAPDGTMTLGGVIEVSGPAPSGTASVGCLASGLTYVIAIDATGDDRGILATRTVTVP